MRAEDAFVEWFGHSEFLHSKNGQYKTVDLNLYEKQHVESFPAFNLVKIDFKRIKLDNEFKVHYDNDSFDIKKIVACIVKGHHLKRTIYLQVISIGLSDLIWTVSVTINNLTNEKNKTFFFFCWFNTY